MNLILLGPPGSGKGTQAEKISSDYDVPHISTGNILRHAIDQGTDLGLSAKKYMNEGKLVPDELVDEIVAERLSFLDCNRGFVLDGFPRDLTQAKALEGIRGIDTVFLVECPQQTLISRLSNRRECSSCGKIYHLLNNPPNREGFCDDCGNKLIQRADDQPQTIKKRLTTYEKETKPLIDYYGEERILVRLDGFQNPDTVYAEIKKYLP
ncbi:MAG: adenylate kinase [Candidatus Altiarchaeales archaeon]|nr:adenylate kinase [Candidatus Altiarchaeales archaeon]